ncbi:phospholipase A [Ramlibacter tataouinensis]|uniref:phospholipase A n=1 Tax=Ramlibacter tataouinensis TaxID=94132 RepID=UPI0022F38C02|nr:phospholipase A [Ramlibacter tataouinensis]WBY00361.1 phospholipase A [Ramlibacter tataouinensis]
MPVFLTRGAAGLVFASLAAQAQPTPSEPWQTCTALAEPAARLACFDRWSQGQTGAAASSNAVPLPVAPPSPAPPAPAAPAPAAPAAEVLPEPPVRSAPGARIGLRLTSRQGCADQRYSSMSRFWELEPGADCGTFGLRGYRPSSIDVVASDSVNRRPTSDNPTNTALADVPYRNTELRLQLSVRTKIAKGLLVHDEDETDSLWLGYTQQSYWQLFTPGLSRPFRNTDHEPEVMYVAPVQSAMPGQWRLRYAGLGAAHQSNGQSLPLSRSWNRAYLMAGAEKGALQLHGRLWRRMAEGGTDDNPAITDWLGRGELQAIWQANSDNLWSVTARHSLRRSGRGSLRVEWFRALVDKGTGEPSGLQLHTQLFAGYGDSLLDYNRRRVTFSVGLSLVDW